MPEVIDEMFLMFQDLICNFLIDAENWNVGKGQILRSTPNTAPLFAALVTLSRKVFRPWHKWF